jgi:hypothetical protein
MDGSAFARSTAMTARQVSQGSVIVLIRFLMAVLSEHRLQSPGGITRPEKGLCAQVRELVRGAHPGLSPGDQGGQAVQWRWRHHRDTFDAVFRPVTNGTKNAPFRACSRRGWWSG